MVLKSAAVVLLPGKASLPDAVTGALCSTLNLSIDIQPQLRVFFCLRNNLRSGHIACGVQECAVMT